MARSNKPKDDAPEPRTNTAAVATDDDRSEDVTIEMATLPVNVPHPARDSGDFPHPDDAADADRADPCGIAAILAAVLRPLATALAAKFRAEAEQITARTALIETHAARAGAADDAAETPATPPT